MDEELLLWHYKAGSLLLVIHGIKALNGILQIHHVAWFDGSSAAVEGRGLHQLLVSTIYFLYVH